MHEFLESEEINFGDFNTFINEQSRRIKKNYSSTMAMYKGDMWDKGRGYIGPLPAKDDDNASRILSNIRRMFTSRNVIEEIVDRAVDGLLSKTPSWQTYDNSSISNNPRYKIKNQSIEEKTEINPKLNEAEIILAELWVLGKLGDLLKKSQTDCMLNEFGKLRIYFPSKKIGKIDNFLEAIKHIKVEFLSADNSVVIEDGIDKLSVVEVSSKGNKKYEISFTDDLGKTYIASVDSNTAPLKLNSIGGEGSENIEEIVDALRDAPGIEVSAPFSLGGNIIVDQLQNKPLVSLSMLQNNRALNLDLSLAVGILIESGYAEMVTTNVSMKTETVSDPDNPGETKEVPLAIERGSSTLTNLVGEQTMNPQTGQIEFQQPSVYWKEPSPLDTFVKGEDLFYRQILSQAKQLFVLITGNATASGESRIQSRQDFLKKIQRYKPALDVHGGWLLNTLLKVVATIANKDGYFDDISVVFDTKVSAGELSADEKAIVISQYTAGLISRETALVLLGSEDPLIEIDKIRNDQAEKLQKQIERLEATAKFGNLADNGRPKELPDGRTKEQTDKQTDEQ